ncbi:MAG: hypothetical protein WC747_01290 [Candidatus Babeliales bacterium]
MKIQNKLLLLAIASIVMPMSITPTEVADNKDGKGFHIVGGPGSIWDYGRFTGTAVEETDSSAKFKSAAAAHQHLAQNNKKLLAAIPAAKAEEKAAVGPSKKLITAHRISLEKAQKHTENATKSLQQDANRISEKVEKLEKQFRNDLESIAKARDEKNVATSKEDGYVKAPNTGFKKYKPLAGNDPRTWSPVITTDPSTGYSYIQKYDKYGKLGPKEVYRRPSSK